MPRRAALLGVLGLSLYSPLLAVEPAPGKQVAASVKVGESEVRFLLFLPAKYQAAGERWPLMLFLHGAGERGDNLEAVQKHGPPKRVATDADFPFVLVSPQCEIGKRWDAALLLGLLDAIQAKHHVDPARTYVTGLSMGGYGSWLLAATAPERFAAAIPICGGGDPQTADKLKGVPLWVFHGTKDTAVKIERSQEMVDAVKAAGGNVKFTIYPEAGHDSWTETYNNAEVYRWLLAQKKAAS